MTYMNKKQVNIKKNSSPAKQSISDTYVEITGSRGSINTVDSNSKIVYRFGYNIQIDGTTGTKWFLHIKLQKSTDSFSSNITDVEGANYNVSSDQTTATDHLYRYNTAFFVINGLDGDHELRLVCRAYSSSLEPQLHQSDYFDGIAETNYTDTSLIIFEV
tara:strand:+ start:4212 stop:4691 length:480 start_codon:yes stop_codon:yes gene_type:complete